MEIAVIAGIIIAIGSIGLVYPKIIKHFKIHRKTEAEYYGDKFVNATPANDKRKATRDVIFAWMVVVGSVLLVIGLFLKD